MTPAPSVVCPECRQEKKRVVCPHPADPNGHVCAGCYQRLTSPARTCPECGKMAAHSRGDNEKPSEAEVTMTCPKGHRFSAQAENLLRFEWGAQ